MNIYVGNLAYNVSDNDLRETFESHGNVSSATVIKDKYSGDSKGFGFVEMGSSKEGQEAIETLNGKELQGRALVVNEARPRSNDRAPRGSGTKRRW